jgi:hypothetical protein
MPAAVPLRRSSRSSARTQGTVASVDITEREALRQLWLPWRRALVPLTANDAALIAQATARAARPYRETAPSYVTKNG